MSDSSPDDDGPDDPDDDRDLGDDRQWFGTLDDHPALVETTDIAATTVRVPNEVILEYATDADLDREALLVPLIVGLVVSSTCRRHGYVIDRVTGLKSKQNEVRVDVDVTGAVA